MNVLSSKLSRSQAGMIAIFIAITYFADKALIGLAIVWYQLYSDDLQGWIVILCCVGSAAVMSFVLLYWGTRRVILGDIVD